MNKTLYLRDDEVPLWERARELSGDKLSPVIITSLRRYVSDKEAEAKSFQRIVVPYQDARNNDLPKAKAFYGKWIIPPDEEFGDLEPEKELYSSCYAVAITAKSAAIVYCWHQWERTKKKFYERFYVYPDLEAAASDDEVNRAVCEAIVRRGVPVEELDI